MRPPLFFFFFFSFLCRFLLLGSVSFFHFSNNDDICDNYCYTQVATNWQLQHFISFPFHAHAHALFTACTFSSFCLCFCSRRLATGAFSVRLLSACIYCHCVRYISCDCIIFNKNNNNYYWCDAGAFFFCVLAHRSFIFNFGDNKSMNCKSTQTHTHTDARTIKSNSTSNKCSVSFVRYYCAIIHIQKRYYHAMSRCCGGYVYSVHM